MSRKMMIVAIVIPSLTLLCVQLYAALSDSLIVNAGYTLPTRAVLQAGFDTPAWAHPTDTVIAAATTLEGDEAAPTTTAAPPQITDTPTAGSSVPGAENTTSAPLTQVTALPSQEPANPAQAPPLEPQPLVISNAVNTDTRARSVDPPDQDENATTDNAIAVEPADPIESDAMPDDDPEGMTLLTGNLGLIHGDDFERGLHLILPILASPDGPVYELMVNASQIDPYVGQRVQVKGEFLRGLSRNVGSGRQPIFLVREIIPLAQRAAPQNITPAQAIAGAQPWVNLLCKFADYDAEPNPPAWYQNIFEDSFAGLTHYWQAISYGNINLSGTATIAQWVTMPQPRDDYLAQGHANLDRLMNDCIEAADPYVNYPDFVGINLHFNADLDCCAWGGTHAFFRDGQFRSYRVTWLAPWAQDYATIAHEMGHGFGMPHSSGPVDSPPDSLNIYVSRWDVMSNPQRTKSFCADGMWSDEYECAPTGTIGRNLFHAGWLAQEQVIIVEEETTQTLTLQRLVNPTSDDPLLAIVPISTDGTRYYTVEVRDQQGYDANVPSKGVIIHHVDETRTGNAGPALVVDADAGQNVNVNDAGAIWLPGEQFVDAAFGISISILSEGPTTFTIEITNTAGSVPNDNPETAAGIDALPYTLTQSVNGTQPLGAALPNTCGTYDRGLWYRYTATVDERVEVNTFGSDFDTLLGIYEDTPDGLIEIACNDDATASAQSSVQWSATAGETYTLLVGFDGPQPDATLQLNLTPIVPPENDTITAASAISALPYQNQQDVRGASHDSAIEPHLSCWDAYDRGVWYQFTPSQSAPVSVDTFGSGYDTVIGIFSGTPGDLEAIACNHQHGSANGSKITWEATADTAYFIVVARALYAGVPNYWDTSDVLHLNVRSVSNDDIDTPIIIDDLPYTTTQSIDSATRDARDPLGSPCGGVPQRTLWYRYTPTIAQEVTIDTSGSTYDVALAVYAGPPDLLTELACSPPDPPSTTLTWQAMPGTTYHIKAAALDADASGSLTMTLAGVAPRACDVGWIAAQIIVANADPDETTIDLEANCAYTLHAPHDPDGIYGLPSVTTPIIINGHYATIERSLAPETPAFGLWHVAPTGELTLNRLTLQYGDQGRGGGGAVVNEGDTTLSDVRLVDNRAYQGGAILTTAGSHLDVRGSTLERNSADFGGAIASVDGDVLISRSTFRHNTASDNGGALDVLTNAASPILSIGSTTFEGNSAGYGGALHLYAQTTDRTVELYVSQNTFQSNRAVIDNDANAGQGGAIKITVPETSGLTRTVNTIIYGNQFADNSAVRDGGAIHIAGGSGNIASLSVIYAGFADNQATHGGAIASMDAHTNISAAQFSGNQAQALGGALHATNPAHILNINGTSFIGNVSGDAGGAVRAYRATISETTFTGNATTNPISYGGALYTEGTSTIIDSRFFQNQSAHESSAYHAVSGGTFTDNCVVGNSGLAVSAGSVLDATDSWWGAANGPGGFGTGIGDPVGTAVRYVPFLTTDDFGCGGISQIISGFVLDAATGDPIPDATVAWFIDAQTAPATTTTGSRGEYTLRDVPLDTPALLWADADGYAAEYYLDTADIAAAQPLTLTSAMPDAVDVNFTLAPQTTLSGRVYGANGVTPLGNVPVVVAGWPEWTTICTAPNGRYTLPGLTVGIPYRIAAGGDNARCGDTSQPQIWWQAHALPTQADPLIVPDGGLSDIHFVLDSAAIAPVATIHFSMVDLDDYPGIIVGDAFDIAVRGTDWVNQQALRAAYMDLAFDPTYLAVEGITYAESYDAAQSGTIGTGSLINLGAMTTSDTPPDDDLLFTLHMRAISASAPDAITLAMSAANAIRIFGSETDVRDFTTSTPASIVSVPAIPDPIITAFDIVTDHVLGGTAEVTVEVANDGTAPTAPLSINVFYSSDETIGNADDTIIDTLTFDALGMGETIQQTATLSLNMPDLYAQINIEDPPGQDTSYLSSHQDYLYVVIASEAPPTSMELGTNADDFTIFPWDTGTRGAAPNGIVDTLDAAFVLTQLDEAQPDRRADVNYDGLINQDDVRDVRTRFGYRINAAVFEGTAPDTPWERPHPTARHAEVRLQIIELDTQPGITTGETFHVQIHVTDVRDVHTLRGMFAAYTDVTFDAAYLQLDDVLFNPQYPLLRDYQIVAGGLANVGAVSAVLTPSPDTHLATLEMTALREGLTRIDVDRPEGQFALTVGYGADVDQRFNTVYYGTPLTIAAPLPPPRPPTAHTVGVYTPETAMWYFRDPITGEADLRFQFGVAGAGWHPVVGDWDGDGSDGIGLYKDGLWLLRETADGGNIERRFLYGNREAGWHPVVGDWDGDGSDGIGLYKDGLWLLRNNATQGPAHIQLRTAQAAGAIPLAGDWFNAGRDSVGIYHNGIFFLRYSSAAQDTTMTVQYGSQDNWHPVVGDWNADGSDTIGLFSAGIWRLRNANTAGVPDIGFHFGVDGIPLAQYNGDHRTLSLLAQAPIRIEDALATPSPTNERPTSTPPGAVIDLSTTPTPLAEPTVTPSDEPEPTLTPQHDATVTATPPTLNPTDTPTAIPTDTLEPTDAITPTPLAEMTDAP